MNNHTRILSRCAWAIEDSLLQNYHDNEWGIPIHDDLKLFEFLVLEGFQAGLSWLTILKKRSNFYECFDNFNPAKMANYDDKKFHDLLEDPRIIRNKLKIQAAIDNAKAFLALTDSKSSFSKYIWNFVDGIPVQNAWRTRSSVPSSSEVSKIMAHELKKSHFKFVGNTTCYAFMQAVGMVNDHTTDCFRYHEIKSKSKT